MRKINVAELLGKKFGRLLVTGISEQRLSKSGSKLNYYLCLCDCGKTKNVYRCNLLSGTTKSCGCINFDRLKNQFGENNISWKGGRHVESNGYIEIRKTEHPNARQNGYVKEHILVMEKKLGRYLLKGENVHHLNGDKQDNRIKNLELWSTSQPCGQRVEDKLKWAKEIIKLYG